MKLVIDDEIKNNRTYLTIQRHVKRFYTTVSKKEDLDEDHYITLDIALSGKVIGCTWKELPTPTEDVWEEGDHMNTTLHYIYGFNKEQKQFIKDNWKKLIWGITPKG